MQEPAPSQSPDEFDISEQEFNDYVLTMIDSLTRLAVAFDHTLLARLLSIAAFEARRLKEQSGPPN
jgi:hypothetical protein